MATSVGDVLNRGRECVRTFIQAEVKEPRTPQFGPNVQAARDLFYAFDNAQVKWEYAGVLTQLEEKVDGVVRGQLDELNKMLLSLKSKEATAIADLSFRVQELIKSLKLGDWQPRLDKMVPGYLFVIQGQCTEIYFHGLFNYAAKYKKAELTLNNGVQYEKLTPSNANQLSFEVWLRGFPETALNNYHLISGTLKVQYNAGYVSNLKWAKYEIFIITNPLSAGKIKITYPKRVVINTAQQHYISVAMSLSRKMFPQGALKQQNVLADPGWTITGVPKIHSREGVVDAETDQFGPHSVTVKLCLPPEGEDVVEKHVEFDEVRDEMGVKEVQEEMQLQWGQPFNFKADTFKIDYESFDGQKFVITKSDQENPYLRVMNSWSGYQLVAKPFAS